LIAAGVDDSWKQNPKVNDNAQYVNSTEDDGFQGCKQISGSPPLKIMKGAATRARHPYFDLQPGVSSGLFPGPKMALLRGPKEEGGNPAPLQHLLTQEQNSVVLNWLRIQNCHFTSEKCAVLNFQHC
jgi:hypothetical protein